MKLLGKRVIQYAGNAIVLEYDSPAAEELLERIIYPFPSPTKAKISATIRVEVTDSSKPSYSIFLGETRIYKSQNKVDFSEMLLSKICYHLAFNSRDGMLFHAAGLGYDSYGILVPGGIGFGKSTFTAWMVANGCDYLSDEFVYFPWESEQMQSFNRPLHLKKASRSVLDLFIDYNADEKLIQCGTHSDLVNPKHIKPDNHYQQPQVRLILFPHYKVDSEFQWKELSPAETGLELMQFLINARNLPEYGFKEIVHIAQKSKAVKFQYSTFEQIIQPIQGLII